MNSAEIFKVLVNHASFVEACEHYYEFGDDFWGDGFIDAYEEIQLEYPKLPKLVGHSEEGPYPVVCKAIKEVHIRLKTEKEFEIN